MRMKLAMSMWSRGCLINRHGLFKLWVLFSLGLLLTSSTALFAGDAVHADHDLARKLMQSGTILPLERILESNQQVYARRLLNVELESDHDRLIYEIEVVNDQGRVIEYQFDARTGQLLREKGEN